MNIRFCEQKFIFPEIHKIEGRLYNNWRCCFKNCKAACITYGNNIGNITENRCNDHIHAPNPLVFKVKEKCMVFTTIGL